MSIMDDLEEVLRMAEGWVNESDASSEEDGLRETIGRVRKWAECGQEAFLRESLKPPANVTARIGVSVDNGMFVWKEYVVERVLLDACPIPMTSSENYSRFMLREIATHLKDSMKEAIKLAGEKGDETTP